jgi:hypothetical protein
MLQDSSESLVQRDFQDYLTCLKHGTSMRNYGIVEYSKNPKSIEAKNIQTRKK